LNFGKNVIESITLKLTKNLEKLKSKRGPLNRKFPILISPLKLKSLPLLKTSWWSEGIKFTFKESDTVTSFTPLTTSFWVVKQQGYVEGIERIR
jgi:hypothetical protein